MTREELKERIDHIIWNYAKNSQVDEIMILIDEYKKPKGKSIEERKQEFRNDVFEFVDQFEPELLENFFTHWSQHGKNDRKMLFEKQKSFGLKARLMTWQRNKKRWDTNKPNRDEQLKDWRL